MESSLHSQVDEESSKGQLDAEQEQAGCLHKAQIESTSTLLACVQLHNGRSVGEFKILDLMHVVF